MSVNIICFNQFSEKEREREREREKEKDFLKCKKTKKTKNKKNKKTKKQKTYKKYGARHNKTEKNSTYVNKQTKKDAFCIIHPQNLFTVSVDSTCDYPDFDDWRQNDIYNSR